MKYISTLIKSWLVLLLPLLCSHGHLTVLGFVRSGTSFLGWRHNVGKLTARNDVAPLPLQLSQKILLPTLVDFQQDTSLRIDEQAYEDDEDFEEEIRSIMAYQQKRPSSLPDCSMVEIKPTSEVTAARNTIPLPRNGEKDLLTVYDEEHDTKKQLYASSAMLQASAPYIAAHLDQIAVFHIPGELVLGDDGSKIKKGETKYNAETLLNDIAITWLLGMKIVLVVSGRHGIDSSCVDNGYEHPHECHNSIREINKVAMRHIEEEAGYARFEVERKLNKCINSMHYNTAENGDAYVVGGNGFYSAKSYGVGPNGENFRHVGVVGQVNTDNIHQVLNNNDIVLLTTVGANKYGDSVCVNGNHLAASIASQLGAKKLIYVANHGSVLTQQSKPESDSETIQEIPLSFAQDMLNYHNVKVHDKGGFATFDKARERLDPHAVEMLLHLGWSSWALKEGGVPRAHIINPTKDGAILEELFTSNNGENTMLYHDEERHNDECDEADEFCHLDQEDWDAFLSSPSDSYASGAYCATEYLAP